MSLRDLILGQSEEPAEKKGVVIRGQSLYVREMSGAERDDFEAAQVEAQRKGEALVNFRARLLVRVLVDDTGARVFSDADPDVRQDRKDSSSQTRE
jgi:alpha-D-ribose 1-methylphosphonate 5-phosphate C-P lyase